MVIQGTMEYLGIKDKNRKHKKSLHHDASGIYKQYGFVRDADCMANQKKTPTIEKRWILQYPQKLIFDIAFVILLFLMLDLFGRFWFAEELRRWEAPLPEFQHGNRILQGNPYLIFEYAPGIWDEQGIEVRINSLGLRGEEIVIPKPKGTRRFMTVGDSSVFGFGVPEEAVFSSVTAASLQDKTGNAIEAINGAIPGYSTYQTINLLRLRTWKADPDVLIVGNIWSDNNFGSFVDKDLIATMAGFEQGILARFHRLMTFSALYRVADWRRRVRSRASKIEEVGQSIYAGEQIGSRRVEINDYAQNLEILIDSAHERNAEVVFLMLANEDDIKKGDTQFHAWHSYREVMKDTARRHALPIVSMVDVFQQSGYSSKELFLDQMHPTVLGHRILGEEFAKQLEGWAVGTRLEGEPLKEERPVYIDSFGAKQREEEPKQEELTLEGMVAISEKQHRDGEFWIDRFEYPNQSGDLPKHSVSFVQAKKLCNARGKRLCTAYEWRRACQGKSQNLFSYGVGYIEDLCHIEEQGQQKGADERAVHIVASGTKKDCRSDEEVHDLIGNLEEWVLESWGGSEGILEGGSWNTFREHATCNGLAVRQPDYRINLENPILTAGARCCWSASEPDATAIKKASEAVLDETKLQREQVDYDKDMEVLIAEKTYIDRLEYPNQLGVKPYTVVNWEEANAICSNAGKRLCESHEWERACGDGRLYPYGDSYIPHACAVEERNVFAAGHYFGCISPNGALDMVGNVWEWTATEHRSPQMLDQPDPPFREIRGGSWFVNQQKGACYPFDDRSASVQNQEYPDLGFRCCRGPILEKKERQEDKKCAEGEVFRAGKCTKYD